MRARIFFTLYVIMVATGVIVCLFINAYIRESLTFAYCEFCSPPFNVIIVGVKNLGTTSVTIIDVHINSVSFAEMAGHSMHQQIEAGETKELGYFFNWSSGSNYNITLITARGSAFSLTETAQSSETLLKIEKVNWNSLTNTTSIIIRNTGIRTRKIIGLYIGKQDSPNIYRSITAFFTNLGAGKLLPINQTVTIVFSWPNSLDSSWVSNQTYCFVIKPETGMCKFFNSSTPA